MRIELCPSRHQILIAAFAIFGVSDFSWFRATWQSPASIQGSVIASLGGPDETREQYIFNDVRGLVLDAKGRVFVADYAVHTVRVFSSSGTLLYTIGRSGAGPSDLNRPCCIALAKDGTLWVREHGNRRYSIFGIGDSSARFLRSVPQLVANPAGALDRVAWNATGGLVDIGDLTGGAYQRAVADPNGAAVWDTIAAAPPDSVSSTVIQRRLPNGNASTSTYAQPFGARALRAFGPNGEVARAVSSNYAITWSDVRGNQIAVLQRSGAGPELSERERETAARTLETIARNSGLSVSSLPFRVPKRKPPVRAMGFDLDGRLWVERSVLDGHAREADIYDRRGRLIAVARWPGHVRLDLWTVRQRTAIGVATDSLGTVSVVRMAFR